jgi:hypothetical protein
LVELAIEGLRAKRDAIELEIQALSKGLKAAVSTLRGTRSKPASAARRKKRSAAARKAQSEKMRAYWAKRKAEGAKQPKKATKTKKGKPAEAVPF